MFDVRKNTIYYARHGSHAYGTNIATSDEDFRGVAVAPKSHVMGFAHTFEQQESKGQEDSVIFDLRKFMGLAAECNPNIIEVLFVDDSDVLECTPVGRLLLDHRQQFLSKKAKFTFSGYAVSQLKRIRTHRSYLLSPPDHKPTREEFGLSTRHKITADMMGAMDKLVAEDTGEVDLNVIELVQKEKQYKSAMAAWNSHEKWKKERNAARADTEAKYGFDCYLDDTEFLTENGWKTYDQVGDTEKLGTVDAEGRIQYQRFTERVSKPYSGQIAILHPRHSNCAVTLNHRMLVSAAHRSRNNGYSTSYHPENADWQIASLQDLLEQRRSCFHVRLTGHANEIDYEIDDDKLILLGCYVSEGCVGKRLTDGTASVLRISQKEGGRQSSYMDTLMQKYPCIRRFKSLHKAGEGRSNDCIEHIWTIADRPLARWLEEGCGSGSPNMRLPSWTRELSARQVDLLLDVMVAGDGTDRPHSRVYYTSSKRLADDVQIMCISAGVVSQVWGPYNYEYAPESMYQVYVGNRAETATAHIRKKSQSLTFENVIDSRIVCFTVPNETLVTRRDGKVAMHGNTKHGMHLVRLLRMCREILSGEGVKVRRPDAQELLAIRRGEWSYDQLISWAEKEDLEMQNLYETSTLPVTCDTEMLNDLCVKAHELHWSLQ